MITVVTGVAHVSFVGVGRFHPARNSGNRETLVAYVADQVKKAGQVQVLVDDRRWMVEPCSPPPILVPRASSHSIALASPAPTET